MKIPLPCEFGEKAECGGKFLPLEGVSWFKWQQGMEYTYFFGTGYKWRETQFYTTFNPVCNHEFVLPDNLLIDTYIKRHGYPLKGTGYVTGVYFVDNKTYVDFILTSLYMAHIQVQCNNAGQYCGGNIIFPSIWGTEKKKGILLKSYDYLV